jgi:hypothetical protein
MVDLQSLTTTKGAKIIMHFEDEEEIIPRVNNIYSHQRFQSVTREGISRKGIDGGPGTIVHVLFNTEGRGAALTEAQFKKWKASPHKDWGHSPMYELTRRFSEAEVEGNFSRPTPEQFEKYTSDHVAFQITLAGARDHKCSLCLSRICPDRHASFDEAALKQAIANFGKS